MSTSDRFYRICFEEQSEPRIKNDSAESRLRRTENQCLTSRFVVKKQDAAKRMKVENSKSTKKRETKGWSTPSRSTNGYAVRGWLLSNKASIIEFPVVNKSLFRAANTGLVQPYDPEQGVAVG
jgi:hypothetical protein